MDKQPEWAETLVQPKPEDEDESKPEKPKPSAAPPKKPGPWGPGDPPFRPGDPIADRIGAADHLEAKRKKVAAIATKDAALRQARRDSVAALNRYFFDANMSSEPADLTKLAALRSEIECTDRQWRNHSKTVQARLSKLLSLPKGSEEQTWSHYRDESVGPALSKTIDDAKAFFKNKIARGSASGVANWKQLPTGSRAFASLKSARIGLARNDDAATAVHEWGHLIEDQIPGAGKAAREFLAYRVGDEQPSQLKKVYPDASYDDKEYGLEDKFGAAVGESRWYDWKAISVRRHRNTLDGLRNKLYESPLALAEKDPEYFKFLLGILDGSLRKQ